MHGPGLDTVRDAKLNEMPILPLRSLQLVTGKRAIHMCTTTLKLMSPLGEMKINTLQVQMREKSQMSGWRCGKTGNTSEAWKKENTGRGKSKEHILTKGKVHERK